MKGVATTTTATAATGADGALNALLIRVGELRDLVVGPEARLTLALWALVVLAAAWLLARRAQRVEGWATWVAPVVAALRFAGLVLLAMLVLSIIPTWLAPSFFVAVAAAAAAIGWSVREIVPDVFASLWLVVERRVRPGVLVASGDVAGKVERVGLRSTRLRTVDGRRLVVPNREFLQRTWADASGGRPRCRAELKVPAGASADGVRSALTQAVLTSARTPLDPELRIARTFDDPDRWEVQCRVVELEDVELLRTELPERFARYLSPADHQPGLRASQ